MASLAIKGHPTRGNEVIEILEMLGGVDAIEYSGNNTTVAYYICETYKNWIQCDHPNCLVDYIILNLEEFLEKFPYKVGDKIIYEDKVREVTKMVWEEHTNTVVYKLDDKLYCNVIKELQLCKELRIGFPEGYGYAGIENKQVIFTKIKPQYPKTYEECKAIIAKYLEMDCNPNSELILSQIPVHEFCKLIVARNAYWKIAGEQMGLDKPWKPDFTNDDEERYGIYTSANKVEKEFYGGGDINTILTFPTEEMRDTFYENFKELIESCKELL